MSLLKRRLQRRQTEDELPWAEPQPSKQDELRRRIGALIERGRPVSRSGTSSQEKPSACVLPGQREETEQGPLRSIKGWLEPEYCHGAVSVGRALKVDAVSVSKLALEPRFSDVRFDRVLFLDTETTGLSGGTGVVPFLVGLAWFEEGCLVVEQLLLEELEEEPALLRRLEQRMAQASCLVTYNGKSYDLPLLRARRIMNSMEPFPELPHLDLLHCSRRVYKPRLKQVRLVDMEESILKFRRERDIDGAEIPGIYWNYLRSGEVDGLTRVLEHNHNDVAALASIMAVLSERYVELHREDDPRDQLARAKVGIRSDDLERAEAFAVAAAEGGGSSIVTADAYECLFKIRRKQGDVQGMQKALQSGLAASQQDLSRSFFHLELSKLFEHRLRDFASALHHAQAMHDFMEGPKARARRIARLERRLEKSAQTQFL